MVSLIYIILSLKIDCLPAGDHLNGEEFEIKSLLPHIIQLQNLCRRQGTACPVQERKRFSRFFRYSFPRPDFKYFSLAKASA